jgi:hypothetical protein
MDTNPLTCRRADLLLSEVEGRARRVLDAHPLFFNRSNNFEFDYRDGTLTVRGAVPTFYLKQMLQAVLKNLEGVCSIDNQVSVFPS